LKSVHRTSKYLRCEANERFEIGEKKKEKYRCMYILDRLLTLLDRDRLSTADLGVLNIAVCSKNSVSRDHFQLAMHEITDEQLPTKNSKLFENLTFTTLA